MHTLLFVVVTSGLVLLQTSQGFTANLEPDADFLEEATADGFIVGTTKGPTKTEKQDHFNAIVAHDSLNTAVNLSLIEKDGLPTVTVAKSPEAITELTTENTHELPKNEGAVDSITVDTNKSTTFSPEENAEGSGIFPEWIVKTHTSMIQTTFETFAEVDIDSDGSGMSLDTLNKNQNDDLLFTTTVHNSGDPDTSTHIYHSSDENSESRMGPEAPTSVWLTTTTTSTVKEEVKAVQGNIVFGGKRMNDPNERASSQNRFLHIKEPGYEPEPTNSALIKEGTPGWLLILAVCLTVGAVICVFVGIATKDKWYGPSRQCPNGNSTESKSHVEYDKAATLPLSEKEKVALMSTQKEARKETDCTISIEEVAEKEYLM